MRLRYASTRMAEPKPARIYLVATSTHLDDKALGHALLEGQPGAANKVWHKYKPMVRRMLARAMGPDREVDNLTQDVFLTFFDKLSGLRKPESLRSFLISVTTFTIRAELRKRWVRRMICGSPATGSSPRWRARARYATSERRCRAFIACSMGSVPIIGQSLHFDSWRASSFSRWPKR